MSRDLIFLHCAHFPRCRAEVDKRFDYHTLQLMTAGRIELRYGERSQCWGPRAVWPCAPGPRIRFKSEDPGRSWAHRYAAFQGPRVERWRHHGLWPDSPIALNVAEAESLAPVMDQIIADASVGQAFATLRAANALESLLIRLAELREGRVVLVGKADGPVRATASWLAAVLDRLDDLGRPDPDYARLADTHAMALSTLRRRFREAMGVSIHGYRLSRKLSVAKDLLTQSDLTLKQIADQLGYRDIYYFSRQFSTEFGVPPGRFRCSRQGGDPPKYGYR